MFGRRRRRELERIAATRIHISVDGVTFSRMSAEEAYLIASYGAEAGVPVDALLLIGARMLTLSIERP